MRLCARVLCPAILIAAVCSQSLMAEDQKKKPAKKPQPGFPGLLTALKKSPGCIGIETANTGSGKNVIFAWFKDKKAAIAWYNSEYHQTVVNRFFPNNKGRKPLKDVPDNVGPIMAIASITFSKKPGFKGVKLPISQIAIELYAPLKGGVSLGGTFSPAEMKRHMKKRSKRK